MVEVFKTNVEQADQAQMLMAIFSEQLPLYKINFDLDDCDKILRVAGNKIAQEEIKQLLFDNGFDCELLE